MSPQQKQTAAVLPAAGYRRPALVGAGGLTVDVVGESGETFGRFDFSGVDAPVELTRALVEGFARKSGPGGRWASVQTVRSGADNLRRFAKEISAANPDVATIGDVTPEVWWGWRNAVESRSRWPSQIVLVRSLLHDVKGLPGTTRRAMNAPASKPKKRTYNAYSRDEFKRIRSAAWHTVSAAASRIEANVDALARHQAGKAQVEPATGTNPGQNVEQRSVSRILEPHWQGTRYGGPPSRNRATASGCLRYNSRQINQGSVVREKR